LRRKNCEKMASNIVVKTDELMPTERYPRHQQMMGETRVLKPIFGKRRWRK
jgi:hypothetical protein